MNRRNALRALAGLATLSPLAAVTKLGAAESLVHSIYEGLPGGPTLPKIGDPYPNTPIIGTPRWLMWSPEGWIDMKTGEVVVINWRAGPLEVTVGDKK